MFNHVKSFIGAFSAVLVILSGCHASETPQKPESKPIKLMTYNIQIGKNVSRTGIDLNRTAAAIARTNPDVVSLNEVDVNAARSGKIDMPQVLGQLLNMQYTFGMASLREPGEYGNAILSKLPMTRLEVFPIPSTPDESRSATIALIDGETPFYLITTHFSYQGDEATEAIRVQAAEAITAMLIEKGYTPAVLMGDLNTAPDGSVIQKLRDLGWEIANDADPEQKTFPADNPQELLDYIAVYPADCAEFSSYRVINEPEASDHRPVYAEIKFIPQNPMVKIATNYGDIVVELYPDKAPETVQNFLNYVDSGFYNDTIFHRVIDGFMIQGGGFDTSFNQKSTNPPIHNEADNRLKNDIGTIAMARTQQPHSATSQFFINVADNKSLNFRDQSIPGYGYCVFGKVVDGMDTVNKIKSVPTGNYRFHRDVPRKQVVIKSITRL